MSGRHGDKMLVGAYASPAFAEAVDLVAKAAGRTRSDMVRDSLAKSLNDVDRLADNLTPDDGDCLLEKSAELRYTLVPVTADEVGTNPDSLQFAVWDLNLRKDKSVRHGGRKVGQVTEAGFWHKKLGAVDLTGTDDGVLRKAKLPPGFAFLGIQWTPAAWERVKAGTLSPNDLARATLCP